MAEITSYRCPSHLHILQQKFKSKPSQWVKTKWRTPTRASSRTETNRRYDWGINVNGNNKSTLSLHCWRQSTIKCLKPLPKPHQGEKKSSGPWTLRKAQLLQCVHFRSNITLSYPMTKSHSTPSLQPNLSHAKGWKVTNRPVSHLSFVV